MFFNQNKKQLHFLLSAIGGGVLLLVILFGYGIYRFHWQGPFVRRLAAVVPYPAMFVDWEVVYYREYLSELYTLEKYWATEQENKNVFLGIPNKEEIRERLVNKLIEEKIVKIWARSRGLSIMPDELEAEWQRVQSQSQGAGDIGFFLNKAYGWGEEKFKKRVLAPFLLEQKAKAALIRENKSDDPSLKTRAEGIYREATADKADFANLAKNLSDDRLSARSGGDLGYFSRGTFEPQLEKTIFAMQIGEISQPLKSSYGYHIFKLDDLLYGDNGVAAQASVRHILVKDFDFDDWLEKQKSRLPIYRLVL